MLTNSSALRSWAEIDCSALRHNLRYALACSQPAEVMAVVKADAYGHGIQEVLKIYEQEAITFLAVANIGEAQRIENLGTSKRLFILGPTFPNERATIVDHHWGCFITDWEEAAHFNQLAQERKTQFVAHIALNSGMGRGGFLPEQLIKEHKKFLDFPHLIIEGIGSHMPVADDDIVLKESTDNSTKTFTDQQVATFNNVCQEIEKTFPLRYKHLANSIGVTDWQVKEGTLTRPGLTLYGHDPLGRKNPSLQQTLSLKSRVTAIQHLPKGKSVSYGRDFITTASETIVATVGIGYADSYPRQISGKKAYVWINGCQCPLLGRVTMDQIMVDITHTPETKPGDEVELFGKHIPAELVAQWADTIVWDIFTGLGKRVTRLYINQ